MEALVAMATERPLLHMAVALWHRLQGARIAASSRRRKRLQRLLAWLQQQERGPLVYATLNPAVPLLRLYGNPEACLKREFSVTRQSVALLLKLIHNPRDHGYGQEFQVLMFLYCLAHGLSLPVVARAFGVPKSTVHRAIHKMASEIKAKLGAVVSLPSPDELPNIGEGFCRLGHSPAFDRTVGALDGCHIWINPPGNVHQEEYLNQQSFYSIQLQAICDATGRFLDVFVGYPGSVPDAAVLRNSPIYTQASYPPSGFCLLADSCYPCLEQPITIITPYEPPLDGPNQERFNRHHSRARSVVPRAFRSMKARWKSTFIKALEVNPAFVPDIIACCAFLHNICITTNDVIELEENMVPDGDPLPLLQDPQPTPGEQETSGHHIRDQMAAAVPKLLPQPPQDHDYL
ncbi:putative nuclease HARBI1 [Gouania willdenowi]|uniref:Putative nuclease HARBI1 n=1 Tax=Gouania willdenowi TaxID=441366 RepID=A0A8C5HVX6_GOUWI|nr:putative nuclease HARBI1 [Gouania willdenowi]